MSEPFYGQISMFPYTFAPLGWAWCEGSYFSIVQNQALYAVIGTTYGGDGRTTFGLPNLQGRAPMHQGAGAGLTPRSLGGLYGYSSITLTTSQLPSHTHTAKATIDITSSSPAPSNDAFPGVLLQETSIRTPIRGYRDPDASVDTLSSSALATTGQSSGHENRQPFMGVYFFIATDGLWPSRS